MLTGARGGGPRSRPVPGPEDFDRPSSARVVDYLLGGSAHGAVDRDFAEVLLARDPSLRAVARSNRTFSRRVVRFLLAAGITQFLDLGSGVPTTGAVHEVIDAHGSDARVAYVDVDAVAVTYGERLLADVATATITAADVRDVDAVLDAPGVREMIDISRPVGLLGFSVLQHVDDLDDPVGLVAGYLAHLRPASALAISHFAMDGPPTEVELELQYLARNYSRSEPRARTIAEVADIVRPVDLVAPGIVRDACWRPAPGRETRVEDSRHWAAVGFLP